MRTLTPHELEMLASQYIDGELDQEARTSFESYLADHPEAAETVAVMTKVRSALSSKPPLEPNHWFWMKVSNRIDAVGHRSVSSLTVRRPAFLMTGAAVLSSMVIGLIYYNDAEMFHRYFLDKQAQVEQVYRNTVLTGNILPLFGNLNNDDVLNFALFGSIPIDSSNTASLKVSNSDESGSQIQIVRSDAPAAPPVTMSVFADEIGISHRQREAVDSIIGMFREKLKASVLVSENERMAIHADLAEMNKTMVSTIAACLEPPQRSRFKRFLDDRHAPYAVVAVNTPSVPSHVLLNSLPKLPRNNNYVVISSDTVSIESVVLNLDSITEVARRQEQKFRRLVTERMMAELTERQHVLEENLSGLRENRVRVHSSSGTLQIHFEHSAPRAVPGISSVDFVRPRGQAPEAPMERFLPIKVSGDSAVMFEMPADDRAIRIFKRLPQGEFRFEMTEVPAQEPRLKVYLRSPSAVKRSEQRRPETVEPAEPLLDLDSLLRESERQPESPPAKPKKTPRELELELMM